MKNVLFAFSICLFYSDLSIAGSFAEDETVMLEIQFGQTRDKKLITGIEFTRNMTVLDAMLIAQKRNKLKFSYRGKNATGFLTEIDGIKNKGARGDNWIFRVNGKLGKQSFAVTPLKIGDKVTWTFGKYRP